MTAVRATRLSGFRAASLAGEYGLILVLALVIVAVAAAEPAFVSRNNVVGILNQVSLIGIVALGMTLVIMTGGIDLSVGPTTALSGLVAVSVLTSSGFSVAWALPLAVGVGAAVGLVNGVFIAVLGLPPIIVTLGTLSAVRGTALLFGGAVLHLVREPASFSYVGSGRPYGVPFPVYIFAACAVVMIWVQRRTVFGLDVQAVGDNEQAAVLAGRGVVRVRVICYMVTGMLAGLAGAVLAARVSTASATVGTGFELDVIAAVVLGGTSLAGGRGSIERTVIGTLFIGVISNAMSILNVTIETQLIVKGLLIALGVAATNRFVR